VILVDFSTREPLTLPVNERNPACGFLPPTRVMPQVKAKATTTTHLCHMATSATSLFYVLDCLTIIDRYSLRVVEPLCRRYADSRSQQTNTCLPAPRRAFESMLCPQRCSNLSFWWWYYLLPYAFCVAKGVEDSSHLTHVLLTSHVRRYSVQPNAGIVPGANFLLPTATDTVKWQQSRAHYHILFHIWMKFLTLEAISFWSRHGWDLIQRRTSAWRTSWQSTRSILLFTSTFYSLNIIPFTYEVLWIVVALVSVQYHKKRKCMIRARYHQRRRRFIAQSDFGGLQRLARLII